MSHLKTPSSRRGNPAAHLKNPGAYQALLAVCLACVPAARAATVGHWRFENAASLGVDSGANGLNLTNINSVASVASVFPVPQGAASNSLAADFELGSSTSLAIADSAAFDFDDFTIEAFVRLESLDGTSTPRIIASQLNTGTGASAAWQFGVTGQGSGIGNAVPFLQLSADGTTLVNLGMAGNTLAANTPYYLAATVDVSATGVNAVFYLQNLNGGPLTSLAVSSASLTGGLFDSTANFAIGSSYTSGARSRFFDGLIDEVQLSTGVLAPNELLIPELSSSALVAAGVLLLGGIHRRSR